MKVYIHVNGQGHMTKMAAMAINDFVTWHEASGNRALQSLYKSMTLG